MRFHDSIQGLVEIQEIYVNESADFIKVFQ